MQLYIVFAQHFRVNLYLTSAKSTISIWCKQFERRRNLECL